MYSSIKNEYIFDFNPTNSQTTNFFEYQKQLRTDTIAYTIAKTRVEFPFKVSSERFA